MQIPATTPQGPVQPGDPSAALGCVYIAQVPLALLTAVFAFICSGGGFLAESDWDTGGLVALGVWLCVLGIGMIPAARRLKAGSSAAWFALVLLTTGLLVAHVGVLRATDFDLFFNFFGLLTAVMGYGMLFSPDTRAAAGVFLRPSRPTAEIPPAVEKAGAAFLYLSYGLAFVPGMLLLLAVNEDDILRGLRDWGPWILLWGAVAGAHFLVAVLTRRGSPTARWAATVLSGVYAAAGLALLFGYGAIKGTFLILLATPVVLLNTAEARAFYRNRRRDSTA
ncbi:hypothetical protein AB0M28_10355 [Streptomyces sp. NPDC051940]|uniref:hypothetical protein n=1 Tax=Streptomyces sp. NPDC051940 TaxID=3155675 RepID=UPI00343C44F1